MIQRIIYTNVPGKAALSKDISTYSTLTKAMSQPRYSAIPPHTPAITFELDLVSLLFMVLKFIGS